MNILVKKGIIKKVLANIYINFLRTIGSQPDTRERQWHMKLPAGTSRDQEKSSCFNCITWTTSK